MNLRNYAYIGDAVWELFIRKKTTKITENSKNLHKITTEKVKASFQAELLHEIDKILTENEPDLARRARNLPRWNTDRQQLLRCLSGIGIIMIMTD